MRILCGVVLALALSAPLCGQESPVKGKIAFTVKGLDVPESFQYDPVTEKYFISNIVGSPGDRDGNGYITRLTRDGEIAEKKFITGLDAPKGMAVFRNVLYIADIDDLKGFDAVTGKAIRTIELTAHGAKFLNDVVAGEDCLYVSDTRGQVIYRIKPDQGEVEVLCHFQDTDKPNGLAIHPKTGKLTVVCWSPGKILEITDGKATAKIRREFKNLDGAAYDGKGNLYFSDYTGGTVYRLSANGKVTVIAEHIASPADISVTPELLLLIPCLETGEGMAIDLK